MPADKLTGMTPSDLRVLADSMGLYDVVEVRASDRIAQAFYEATKKFLKETEKKNDAR